ncbi:hypothetical protein ACSBR2_005025 [Camellia fascicularis]
MGHLIPLVEFAKKLVLHHSFSVTSLVPTVGTPPKAHGGTLSYDQLTELAIGLEMSEQRFLWVARSPAKSASAAYFAAQSQSNPLALLPEGFLDRTKGHGLVVPSWAPPGRNP